MASYLKKFIVSNKTTRNIRPNWKQVANTFNYAFLYFIIYCYILWIT